MKREGIDYFQSQITDISKNLYVSDKRIVQAFTEGKLVVMTHDEVIIVEDWKTNHDPGDEDDGLQKAIERTVKALRSVPKPPTRWWGDEK